MHSRTFVSVAALFLFAPFVFGVEPPVLAGPMVGHVTDSTAAVWIRTLPDAEIDAIATQNGLRITGTDEVLGSRDFHILRFSGLLPDQPVHAEIQIRLVRDEVDSHDLFFRTAPPPEATGTLRIAFGSCSQDSRRPFVPVYEAMAFEQPDIALFVGDNSYFVVGEGTWSTSGEIGDWTTPDKMVDRHMRTRTNPYLQRLLRSIPSYGIWDDHDFGPNNSDRDFVNKDAALNIFKMVWANPAYGTASIRGIFSKFRRGPADIFLLDGRYYKHVKTDEHPDVQPAEAEIWGQAQLQWLLDELERSTAPVKIIANGTQVISQDGRGEGHSNEAPEELNRLLAFLREHKIGGVIFLSGDRHFTEVLRLTQEGGPDLLEFTSSPIQQGRSVEPLQRDHPTHVWAMNGNSYGLLTVTVQPDNQGTIRFEMRDANNYVPNRALDMPAAAEFPLQSLMYPEE